MKKIIVGTIQKPFGIRGEVKIAPQTDFVNERFKSGASMLLTLGKDSRTVIVDTVRKHHGSILVKFESLDTLNDVEHFHRGVLSIDSDERHELPENEYYFEDLTESKVYVNGELLGHVSEVIDTPAHPVLRVKTTERDILIPFVDRFIKSVDKNERTIDVDWMEGL